jgi:molybdopterin converting factor small subunit
MHVRVLFFGATADETGMRSIDLAVDRNADVRVTLSQLVNKFPRLKSHKLRFAINQEYDSADRVLREGDELAVFTAVSGG